jgi:Na+(H+)/acetate symporter ActP
MSDGSTVSDLLDAAGPGILAFLAAIPILIVAVAAMLPRLFAYAAVLVGAGAVAAALDTNPGLPLFAAGVVVTSVGVWLVRRFVRDHHRPSGSEAVAA